MNPRDTKSVGGAGHWVTISAQFGWASCGQPPARKKKKVVQLPTKPEQDKCHTDARKDCSGEASPGIKPGVVKDQELACQQLC